MTEERYFISISYRGTAYHGWQVQPGSITVQQVLQDSLSMILQQEIKVTGCGRTDTGVHARYFMAHFDCKTAVAHKAEKLIHRLNSHLPEDIVVKDIYSVRGGAHARFDAIARTYEYHIISYKNPFLNDLAWLRHDRLSLTDMNKACEALMDYDDFTSFSRLHTDNKTNICRISHAKWFTANKGYVFIIRADRFLRNMVRAIVGTMVEVGTGKLDMENFREIIEAKDRGAAAMSAPAHGLYLTLVEYPYPLE